VAPFAVVSNLDGLPGRREGVHGALLCVPGGVGCCGFAVGFGGQGFGSLGLAFSSVGLSVSCGAVCVVDVDGYGMAGGAERCGGPVNLVLVGLSVAAAGDSPDAEGAKPAEARGFENGVGSVAAGGPVYEGSFGGGVGDLDG
jgi:hypothetical protein